jgi:hypothetical protein
MLLKNDDFARRYLMRAKELLADDGLLGEASVVAVWDSLYNTISMAIYDEAARWGDYRRDVPNGYGFANTVYTVDDTYMAERNRLKNQYFPKRTAKVLSQITSYLPSSIVNGIKTVKNEGPTLKGYYNLQGQLVDKPTKGLYILNGKKVIIK